MLPKVINVVSTCNINSYLPMNRIARNSKDIEFSPKVFFGIIKRFRNPYATVLIFPKGKINISGVTTEAESRLIAKKTLRSLQPFIPKTKIKDFKIYNIVANADFKDIYSGDVVELLKSCLPDGEYKIQKNKSLKLKWNGVTVIVFNTGNVIFMGAKTIIQINNVYNDLCNIIKPNNCIDFLI